MERSKEIIIDSDLTMINEVVQEVYNFLEVNMLEEEHCYNLSVAISEAVNNAIVHGNKNDKSKKVKITVKLDKDLITLSVKDEGEGFDPTAVPDPYKPENLKKPSGRGIFIIKHFMDEVEFESNKDGTLVTMKKRIQTECPI